VVPGKAGAFAAWWAQFSDLAQAQHGFQTGALLHSLRNPIKQVFLMLWESQEARQAWANGAEFGAFVQANPWMGLVTPGRPQEAYDVLCHVTGAGPPAYAGLVEWTLDSRPGNAASFERTRQEFFDLRRHYVPGFVWNGLGRLCGSPSRYQEVQCYSTLDAFRAASPRSQIPQIQAFGGAHPPSAYARTPLSAEVYAVVRVV
jgi:heme-degrading monooxygenase HmoA